jgi:hypothetical protein
VRALAVDPAALVPWVRAWVGIGEFGGKKPRWSSALLRKHAVFHMSRKYRSFPGPSVRCLGIVRCKFKTHLSDDIRGG